jgi:hypothetical protein
MEMAVNKLPMVMLRGNMNALTHHRLLGERDMIISLVILAASQSVMVSWSQHSGN